jgi:ArsR family metal-binding transcriptional regulator
MKNIFFKLSLQSHDDGIYISLNHIVSLHQLSGCTAVETTNSVYRVTESVEEIMEIINKAQQKWL